MLKRVVRFIKISAELALEGALAFHVPDHMRV
jgi:hypothetical protein